MPVVMVTAVHDISVALQALRNGAYDYLLKPFEREQLLATASRALENRRLKIENRTYQTNLESLVANRTQQLQAAVAELKRSYDITLEALGDALDLKDAETLGHSRRVTAFTILIARAMGVPPDFEVIEHINNPIEEINLFNVLLRKNGLLYITTPNFNSLSRYILKQNWNIIEYPEHLSYYSKKTIRKLLVKNGLRKIKIETTGFSFSRFQTSIFDSTTNSKSTDSIIREKSENKWHYKLAKEVINFMLITFNKGDTIKASFIK